MIRPSCVHVVLALFWNGCSLSYHRYAPVVVWGIQRAMHEHDLRESGFVCISGLRAKLAYSCHVFGLLGCLFGHDFGALFRRLIFGAASYDCTLLSVWSAGVLV